MAIRIKKDAETGEFFAFNEQSGTLTPVKTLPAGKSALSAGQRVMRGFSNLDAVFLQALEDDGAIKSYQALGDGSGFLVLNNKGEVGQVDPGFSESLMSFQSTMPGAASLLMNKDAVGDFAESIGMTPAVAFSAVGGFVGGPIGAAIGGAAGEAIKQGIGGALGVADPTSSEAGQAIALSAAVELALPGLRALVNLKNAAGRGLGSFFGKVGAGIPDDPARGVDPLDIINRSLDEAPVAKMGGVRLQPRFTGEFLPLASPRDAVGAINDGLTLLKARRVESAVKEAMLSDASARQVNMAFAVDDFIEGIPAPQGKEAVGIVESVMTDILRARGVLDNLPVSKRNAELLKIAKSSVSDDAARRAFFGTLNPAEADILRREVASKGYEQLKSKGGRISDEVIRQARESQRVMSNAIKNAMAGDTATMGGKSVNFDEVMDAVSKQEEIIGVLGNRFGGEVEPQSFKRALDTIRDIENEDVAPLKEAVDWLSAKFPESRISETVDQAFRGQFFTGPGRTPDIVPRPTATGNFQGQAAVGNIGAVDALTQRVLGITGLGTQRGVIKTIGAVQTLNAGLKPAETALGVLGRDPSSFKLLGLSRARAASLASDLPPIVNLGGARRFARSGLASGVAQGAVRPTMAQRLGLVATPEEQRRIRERRAIDLGGSE